MATTVVVVECSWEGIGQVERSAGDATEGREGRWTGECRGIANDRDSGARRPPLDSTRAQAESCAGGHWTRAERLSSTDSTVRLRLPPSTAHPPPILPRPSTIPHHSPRVTAVREELHTPHPTPLSPTPAAQLRWPPSPVRPWRSCGPRCSALAPAHHTASVEQRRAREAAPHSRPLSLYPLPHSCSSPLTPVARPLPLCPTSPTCTSTPTTGRRSPSPTPPPSTTRALGTRPTPTRNPPPPSPFPCPPSSTPSTWRAPPRTPPPR